ncbi:MAG: hypothetical protein ACTSVI_12520 [Promethearchaeota archaeon]
MQIINQDGEKLEKLDPEKIYIVLIPYAYNPKESFNRSVRIVHWLRTVHKVAVFSPILHTHPYHVARLEVDPSHEDDYYGWDLRVYDAMRDKAVMLFTMDYEISNGCRIELEWARKNEIPIFYLEE